MTDGPGKHSVAFATSTQGAQGSVAESCSLAGTTSAVCAETVMLSAGGEKTQTATTATLTGNELNFQQIPVTAGASLLAASDAPSCTTTQGAAAPTAAVGIFKVLVAPAAAVAAVAAGAFL